MFVFMLLLLDAACRGAKDADARAPAARKTIMETFSIMPDY